MNPPVQMDPFDILCAGTPDPWAYPVHFGEAVLDEQHPLHAHALSQWRGLLTLFALQTERAQDYLLRTDPASLDPHGLLSAQMLARAPQQGMASGLGLWRAPMVVAAQRKGWPNALLALVNPICLVSPMRGDFGEWPFMGWMEHGLCDPLAAAVPPPLTELAILASWLSVVEGALSAQKDVGAVRLLAQVHGFRADCLKHLAGHKLEVNAEAQRGCPLPAPFTALFTECRIAAVANPAALAKGQLALSLPAAMRPNEQLPVRGVILADAALAHHFGQDPRQILIWGTRTLAEVMADPQMMAEAKAQAAAEGWVMITAADLFANQLVRLGKGAVIETHPSDFAQCLLPLRPLALFLGEQLRDAVTLKLRADGAICTLALPMADGRWLSLVKAYAKHPVAGQGNFIDAAQWHSHAVSLWPNFTSPDFDFYAARLFQGTSPLQREAIQPTSVLSRDLMLAMMADCSYRADAMAALQKVNAGDPLPVVRDRLERHRYDSPIEDEIMWRAFSPIEAIGWHNPMGGREPAYCGLLLMQWPQLTTRDAPMDVALDFGTTNSVACFSDGAPIVFADRLVLPIQSDKPAIRAAQRHDKRFVFNKFMPLELRALPTPSVTLGRGTAPTSGAHGLFRNVIFFLHDEAQVDNGEEREWELLARDLSKSQFNLKWSNSATGNDAAMDFLAQCITMIAAEAVARGCNPRLLNWHFSVPDAMSPRRRNQFEHALEYALARLGAGTGHAQRRRKLAPLQSEGLAAARYMLAGGDEATHKLLTAVIDIGGGTSDITLWDSDALQWKGSFHLAGRDFFTNTLNKRPDILEGIGLGFWGRMLRTGQAKGGIYPDAMAHSTELLFNGDQLTSALGAHWNGALGGPVGAPLRAAALTFLGGMAWYLGLVTRGLLTEERLLYGTTSTPAFALCGRGAGVFKLMHKGEGPTGQSDATAALSLFSMAAELDSEPRPQLLLKPDAKMEVVRGMLTDPPRLRAAAAAWDDPKLGQARLTPFGLALHFADGESLAKFTPINADLVARRVMHLGYDDFDTFLKALRDGAGIAIDVHPDKRQAAWDRIEDAVLAHWANVRHAPDDMVLEPPFIVALRALLKEIIDPEASAMGQIDVQFL